MIFNFLISLHLLSATNSVILSQNYLLFFPADPAKTKEKKGVKETVKKMFKILKVCYKHVTTKSNIYKITYHYVRKEYCAF